MSSKDSWRDCTEKCMSRTQGDCFSAALTRREPTDKELASSLSLLCSNLGTLVDSSGRTILHMASSLGRRDLVQWLVQRYGANINAQDQESGYTPLHRSIFYGQLNVAMTLVQMGADQSILDNNSLSPIELAMKDRMPDVNLNKNLPCELYVWGTNTNFNLGTGNMHGRMQPEVLDFFRKLDRPISIIQVYMEKFHTVMVSACGHVWTCGHGQGGRLGLGSERTSLVPQKVHLGSTTKNFFQNPKWLPGQPEICVAAAVGRDHTLLLMESYAVLVFGLNTHHVLGLNPPPDKLLTPQRLPMKNVEDVKFPPQGVCAGRFHSVIWSHREILTFGLNAGQLGHPKSLERTIILPKPVNAIFYKDSDITHVAASDGATVVAINNRHIWVFHEYQRNKISMRYSMVIEQVAVVGGHLDSELDSSILSEKGEPLKVAAISKEGSVFLWQEKDLQMTRCILSPSRRLRITDIHLKVSRFTMLMVSDEGEAYLGLIKATKKKAVDVKPSKGRRTPFSPPGNDGEYHVHHKQSERGALKEFLDPDVCYSVDLERLPCAHRAIKIASDPKGKNFGLIQINPSAFLNDVPELPPERQGFGQDLSNLLSQASEWDTLHDLVFQVEQRRFPAHQFIVGSHSKILLKMVKEAKDTAGAGNVPVIKISGIPPYIFEQLLHFMYAGECSLVRPIAKKEDPQQTEKGVLPEKSVELDTEKLFLDPEEEKELVNPLLEAKAAAKKLGLSKFLILLNSVKYQGGEIVWARSRKTPPFKLETIQVDWKDESEFSDVCIRSKDGVVFNVHKCLLAARSEYFLNMLAGGWIESRGNQDLQLPLDQHVLFILFDYIYKDVTPTLDIISPADFELAMRSLIAADLLLINPFKVRCEAALASLLSFRNVKVALEFAHIYNANNLRDCCYQFVCHNLPSVLESGTLNGLPSEVLEGLRNYYHRVHPRMEHRIITPFSCAPTADYLKDLASNNNILWDEVVSVDVLDEMDGEKRLKLPPKKKARTRRISETLRTRHRTDSVSSVTSDDMDTSVDAEPLDWSDLVEKEESNIGQPFEKLSLVDDEDAKETAVKNEQWVKFIGNSKAQKSIQARLKAAAIAREETLECTLTTLSPTKPVTHATAPALNSPCVSSPAPQAPMRPTNNSSPVSPKILEKHFPQLSGDVPKSSGKISMSAVVTNGKRLPKLSQKQRKRLASEDPGTSPPPTAIAPRGWGHREEDVPNAPPSFSLADIMQEQLHKSKLTSPEASKPINIKSSPNWISNSSPSAHHSSSSPWGKVDIDVSSMTPPAAPAMSYDASPGKCGPDIKFSDIMADEMKQRENWTRMRAKPLNLTQIEDKAIDDLINFYNANEACEERISVRRVVSNQVARPVWVTSKHQNISF